MNRRTLAALLALTFILALAGCKEDPAESAVSERMPPTVPIEGPAHEGTDIASSPFVGSFVNSYSGEYRSAAADVYKDADLPTLTINPDGSFVLTTYIFETSKTVEIRGTLAVDGETATLSVTSRSGDGFLGDDVETAALALLDKNEMKWRGEQIGSVSSGDIFTRTQ